VLTRVGGLGARDVRPGARGAHNPDTPPASTLYLPVSPSTLSPNALSNMRRGKGFQLCAAAAAFLLLLSCAVHAREECYGPIVRLSGVSGSPAAFYGVRGKAPKSSWDCFGR
jgi:hypothetical protein